MHRKHVTVLLAAAGLSILFLGGCTSVEHGSGAPPATASATPGSVAAVADSGGGDAAPAIVPAPAPVRAPVVVPVDSALRGRVPRTADTLASPVIRAIYANRWATHSWKKMHHLIAIADTTEVNGIVLDLKDEFGLNYRTKNPAFAANAGNAGFIPDLDALLDTIKAHGIVPIARMVVFKDSVTARVHPDWTIRKADGSIWRDKKGIAWVNPYHHELWEYNIGVAEELAKRGFPEIQFDYIRFPEPYPSLPKQVFPGSGDVTKPRVLAGYLEEAKERLNALGVRSTADIFGLVTQVHGALEVGQEWEQISPHVNVVLPMVYPSLYPPGQGGIANPNAEPYRIINAALVSAHARDERLGITAAEHVRPWLQAFNLGKPPYGPAQLRDEKRAAYDAGYDGWVLWNPGSNYDVFVPALEKTLVSRKKAP